MSGRWKSRQRDNGSRLIERFRFLSSHDYEGRARYYFSLYFQKIKLTILFLVLKFMNTNKGQLFGP